MNFLRTFTSRLQICILSACSFLLSTNGFAFELGSGAGFINYGDDRTVPCLHSWMQTSFGLLAGVTQSGEKNSNFAQQTALLHLSYGTSLPKSKTLEANLGVGGILFRTQVNRIAETQQSAIAISRAAGLALGLRWKPKLSKNVILRLSWDSLYVPPGTSALYLAFGHAQSVALGLGWNF